MNSEHLHVKENPIWSFLSRWRQAMTTFIITTTVLGTISGFTYKALAEGAIKDTVKQVAKEELEKRLRPVQVDIQDINGKMKEMGGQFDTVNSQQVQIIMQLDLLKEIFVESDPETYKKVLEKRKLRMQ